MYDYPDKNGHFGPYGGIYVAETLMGALDELKLANAPIRVSSTMWAVPARFIMPAICRRISAARRYT